MHYRLFLFAFIVLLSGLGITSASDTIQHQSGSHTIPNQYIVILKDDIKDSPYVINELKSSHHVQSHHTYNHLVKGFSGLIPADQVESLRHDPRVQMVTEDRIVTINSHTRALPPSTQTIPTGIRRIGKSIPSLSNGDGVGVAVIDTGIDLTHPDLKQNIIASKSCIRNRSANDDNGHGTHVAGTIAAANNTLGVVGVASSAKLLAVKVLDSSGSGSWSSVICGIDWVTANAKRYNIRVANMSLGGPGTSDNNCGLSNNDPLHAAICRSVGQGVTYVVAAGNEGANADTSVPASYNDAVITTSALVDTDGISGGSGTGTSYGPDDTFASFSNFGSSVDIAAPGVNINSTWKGGGYRSISGTSMASPHVAGAAALVAKNNPGYTWQQIKNALQASGEAIGSGHSDPSGRHPEPVLNVSAL